MECTESGDHCDATKEEREDIGATSNVESIRTMEGSSTEVPPAVHLESSVGATDVNTGVQVIEESLTQTTFSINGNKVSIPLTFKEEQLEPLFSGTSWGNIVWDASVLLANYIATSVSDSDVVGKSVCELGAGFGLPGLACAFRGASQTVLTDQPPELDGTRAMISMNQQVLNDKVSASALSWGSTNTKEFVNKVYNSSFPDIIIASDCVSSDVYGWESIELLIQTITELSGANSVLYLCSRRREGDGLLHTLDILRRTFQSCEQCEIVTKSNQDMVEHIDSANLELYRLSGCKVPHSN